MFKIAPMEWLVTTNVIFDRHLGREVLKSKLLFKSYLRRIYLYWVAVHSDTFLYHFNGTVTWKKQPKILQTFFPFIFYGKTKLNSLPILTNKNTFKAHKILLQMHQILNISKFLLLNGEGRGECVDIIKSSTHWLQKKH